MAVEEMKEEVGAREGAHGGEPKQAARRDDYTSLERAVASLLPFFTFSTDGGERCWMFDARRAKMTARVVLNTSKSTVTLTVADDLAGEVIELWTTEVRITGDKWRYRLRQAVGVTLSLAYFRPWCSKCHGSLVLRRRGSDRVQFFGCMNFPNCQSTLGIVAHDIDRGSA